MASGDTEMTGHDNFFKDIYDTCVKLRFCLKHNFPARFALCDFDIHDIHDYMWIPHPIGIVINTSTKFGRGCIVMQNVTIGNRWLKTKWGNIIGSGKADKSYPPTFGNNVFIGAGATILGEVKIGNNVIIAARALVLDDIPDNTIYISKDKKYHYDPMKLDEQKAVWGNTR
jgi:serine acetyltransferase